VWITESASRAARDTESRQSRREVLVDIAVAKERQEMSAQSERGARGEAELVIRKEI
jgi:hypothetical protein